MKEEQFTQILRAINDVRGDLKEFKDEMNRRWDENDKRWEENDKRWQSNSRDHAIIHEKIDKLSETVERRYHDTLKVFDSYEIATQRMYQENRQKIEMLQRQLKTTNA